MKYILLAMSLLLFPMQSLAQPNCLMKGSGTGYGIYEQDGEDVAYEVSTVGTSWGMQGYGWHATAALTCEYCRDPNISWGLVNLSDGWSHRIEPRSFPRLLPSEEAQEQQPNNSTLSDLRITNAAQRAARRYEFLYYPMVTFGSNDLTPIHLSEKANVNNFEGYAVVFEISHHRAGGADKSVNGLIAFEVTDGCAYFSGTVGLPLEAADQQLERLLSSISISRVQVR
ncbi:MAG: hypothetical protein ABJH45_17895 [Paracoccaceae bacterium]